MADGISGESGSASDLDGFHRSLVSKGFENLPALRRELECVAGADEVPDAASEFEPEVAVLDVSPGDAEAATRGATVTLEEHDGVGRPGRAERARDFLEPIVRIRLPVVVK